MTQQQTIVEFRPSVPVNYSAEKAALSCILANWKLLDHANWKPELFFDPAHRTILESALKLHKDGVPTDVNLIVADLERSGKLQGIGGIHNIYEIQSHHPVGDPTTANYYRQILVECDQYRNAYLAASQAADQFVKQEGSLAELSTKIANIAAQTERKSISIADHIMSLVEELSASEPPERFECGLPMIDGMQSGALGRGDLLTVAAPTSGGKSIILLQLALRAAQAGKAVAIFSLEMPGKKVLRRLLANLMGKPVRGNSDGASREDHKALASAVAEIKKMKLQIETEFSDMESIEGTIRQLHGQGKCDLAVVDYIQLVHLRALGRNETREQHVAEISRRLKLVATSLNICVATASQLNDDGKLRESRAIGMNSDHVWIIHRSEDGDFISLDKVRDGERGVIVPVLMQGHLARFVERTKKPSHDQ